MTAEVASTVDIERVAADAAPDASCAQTGNMIAVDGQMHCPQSPIVVIAAPPEKLPVPTMRARWLWFTMLGIVTLSSVFSIVRWFASRAYINAHPSMPATVAQALPWIESDWKAWAHRYGTYAMMVAMYSIIGAIIKIGFLLFGLIGRTMRLVSQQFGGKAASPMKRAVIFLVMWSFAWCFMFLTYSLEVQAALASQVVANLVLLGIAKVLANWRYAALVGGAVRLILGVIFLELYGAYRQSNSLDEVPKDAKNVAELTKGLALGRDLARRVGFPAERMRVSKTISSSHFRSFLKNDIVLGIDGIEGEGNAAQYAGVAGHELGHWVHGDMWPLIAFFLGTSTILGALPFLVSALPAGVLQLACGGVYGAFGGEALEAVPTRTAAAIAVSDIVGNFTMLIIQPLWLAHSRYCEYRADRHSVEMGVAQGQYDFLADLAAHTNLSDSKLATVLGWTHPPTDVRLITLREEMERKGQTFVMPKRKADTRSYNGPRRFD